MAPPPQLPCDGDGTCMSCKSTPSDFEKVLCKTCGTPWHVDCLSSPPEFLSSDSQWECPDCCTTEGHVAGEGQGTISMESSELIAKIREIEGDTSLTEQQKAKKRQMLMSQGRGDTEEQKKENQIMEIMGENIKCSFCMQLPQRPVTVRKNKGKGKKKETGIGVGRSQEGGMGN